MLYELNEPLHHLEDADQRVSQLMEEIINQDVLDRGQLIDQLMAVSDTLRLLKTIVSEPVSHDTGPLPTWHLSQSVSQ